VPGEHVARQVVLGDAAEPEVLGSGERGLDQLLAQADRLEDLRAAVRVERGDAHLGHRLEDALLQRLDEIVLRLFERQALRVAPTLGQGLSDGLEG